MVRFGGGLTTGGMFNSFTNTDSVFESLMGGWPSSVTRTTAEKLPPPKLSSGAHVIVPVAGWMLIVAGAPGSRLYVRVWPASGSLAVMVTVKVLLSETV